MRQLGPRLPPSRSTQPDPTLAASSGTVSGAALGAWGAMFVVAIVASQWAPSNAAVRYSLWAILVYLVLTNTSRIAGPIERFGRDLGS